MKERQIYHELWLQKKSTDEEGWHDLTEEEYQVVFEEYFNQNIRFDNTVGDRESD